MDWQKPLKSLEGMGIGTDIGLHSIRVPGVILRRSRAPGISLPLQVGIIAEVFKRLRSMLLSSTVIQYCIVNPNRRILIKSHDLPLVLSRWLGCF